MPPEAPPIELSNLLPIVCKASSGGNGNSASQGQDDRAKATCGNQEANGAKPRNPWTDAQELTELAVEGNALLSHPSAISR